MNFLNDALIAMNQYGKLVLRLRDPDNQNTWNTWPKAFKHLIKISVLRSLLPYAVIADAYHKHSAELRNSNQMLRQRIHQIHSEFDIVIELTDQSLQLQDLSNQLYNMMVEQDAFIQMQNKDIIALEESMIKLANIVFTSMPVRRNEIARMSYEQFKLSSIALSRQSEIASNRNVFLDRHFFLHLKGIDRPGGSDEHLFVQGTAEQEGLDDLFCTLSWLGDDYVAANKELAELDQLVNRFLTQL